MNDPFFDSDGGAPGHLGFGAPGGLPHPWLTAEIPVGAILPFAGPVVPRDADRQFPDQPPVPGDASSKWAGQTPVEAWGWTLCDGRSLDIGKAPELYAAIGKTYGGDGDQFKLPNLQGWFLRGVDPSGAVDRDAGEGGRPLGSKQLDALQQHVHSYEAPQTPAAGEGEDPAALPGTSRTSGAETPPGASPEVRVSTTETRPCNVAVHFLIKVCNIARP